MLLQKQATSLSLPQEQVFTVLQRSSGGLLAEQAGVSVWQTQWASALVPEQTQKSLPGYGHSASAFGLHEAPEVGFVSGQIAPLP